MKGGRMLPLDELLGAASRGELIDENEVGALQTAGNGRLEELCEVAAELRDQGKGRTVTFSPKVFIPLTRLCRDFCGYCTFQAGPRSGRGNAFYDARGGSPSRSGRAAAGLHRSTLYLG